MAKAKKIEVPLARLGVRFLVNRIETTKWDELAPEILLEWLATGDDKLADDKLKAWLASAKNNERFVCGVNRIVAIELQ
jgi:hypothetical protein